MIPLHVHSHFSLLRGASSIEELVARAAELGYRSLALTDRDALYGAVRFTRACASAGLHPVVGSEVTLGSGHQLTVLAENQTGYGNLCRLVSLAHRNQPKGTAALAFDPHALLAPILKDTLGIFLFQEQIILGVMALTGCSAGEADVVRRAMGSHRSREAMAELEPWFRERATANGIEPTTAAEMFRQISGFADFGFCKSHSAALARTAYEGLYLKRYHPAAFYAALLSNQHLGFYPTEVLVWDGRRHGVRFLPVDVNRSQARFILDGGPPLVRLGFEQVRGVGPEIAAAIVAERQDAGSYRSLADFSRRTGLTGKPVEGLVLAGAFAFERRSRAEQLWEVYGQVHRPVQPSLPLPEEPTALPTRSVHEQVVLDHVILGFSLNHHLVAGYRRRLKALGVVTSDQLGRWPARTEVRVGGLVVCRQQPATAKGFVFLTIEDETGLANVIVRPDVYQQYRDPLRNHALVAVAGIVQRAFGTVTVVAVHGPSPPGRSDLHRNRLCQSLSLRPA